MAGLDALNLGTPSAMAAGPRCSTIVDIAEKAGRVGSVGLRAHVVLCEGSRSDDVVLLIQLKQAAARGRCPVCSWRRAWDVDQGQRVVEYQQRLQMVSIHRSVVSTIAEQTPSNDCSAIPQHEGQDRPGRSEQRPTDYVGICGWLLAKGMLYHRGIHGRWIRRCRANSTGPMRRFARAYATRPNSIISGYCRPSPWSATAHCRPVSRGYADRSSSQSHQAMTCRLNDNPRRRVAYS